MLTSRLISLLMVLVVSYWVIPPIPRITRWETTLVFVTAFLVVTLVDIVRERRKSCSTK